MTNPGGYGKSIKSRAVGKKNMAILASDKMDPNEKYWADEETNLRKRGIDPMGVPQIKPVKVPTHPGTATLHKKGGMVKGRDYGKGK